LDTRVYIMYAVVYICCNLSFTSFFFNDPATTELYTLSLHDALPTSASAARLEKISARHKALSSDTRNCDSDGSSAAKASLIKPRSEEHTSELQSLAYLVCRLLLEKKKIKQAR